MDLGEILGDFGGSWADLGVILGDFGGSWGDLGGLGNFKRSWAWWRQKK